MLWSYCDPSISPLPLAVPDSLLNGMYPAAADDDNAAAGPDIITESLMARIIASMKHGASPGLSGLTPDQLGLLQSLLQH